MFAESPDRIFISQRGETRLPDPVPPEFAGWVGSIGINALRDAELRTWQNCLMVVDGDGNLIEVWDQWDHLCDESDGPGPHRVRISPYDPERRVWVINESRHQIFVLSNDGSELLLTLGEKNVGGSDETHFGRPQDVAFLPDGRVLVADGLDNHRIIILDAEGRYQSEFGGFGTDPGQFNGIHALGVGPDGLIFALDRANGRVQKFRISSEATGEYHPEVDHLATWSGFGLPLDLIVNEDHLWVSDLRPLKMVKLDFDGNRLYTWNVSNDGPTGFLEVHTISVDSEGNLYGGDNQHGAHAEAGAEDGRGSGAVDRTAVDRPLTAWPRHRAADRPCAVPSPGRRRAGRWFVRFRAWCAQRRPSRIRSIRRSGSAAPHRS